MAQVGGKGQGQACSTQSLGLPLYQVLDTAERGTHPTQEAAEDKAHSPVHTPSPAGAAPPSLGAPSVSGCGAWRHLQSRQCHGGLPRACPVLVPADQGWAGRSWACGAMLYTPVPQRPLQPAPCAPAQLRKDCWLATALNRDALKECDNACDFMLTFF